MKFHKTYFLLTLALFFIETIIALFIRDTFVRPIFGDFLAVIFVYCLLKSIFNKSVMSLAILSLLVAYLLEALQFFEFLKITGLCRYHTLKLFIGNSFSWVDILAYTCGFVFILLIEKLNIKQK